MPEADATRPGSPAGYPGVCRETHAAISTALIYVHRTTSERTVLRIRAQSAMLGAVT
jgi:hypothetical protein